MPLSPQPLRLEPPHLSCGCAAEAVVTEILRFVDLIAAYRRLWSRLGVGANALPVRGQQRDCQAEGDYNNGQESIVTEHVQSSYGWGMKSCRFTLKDSLPRTLRSRPLALLPGSFRELLPEHPEDCRVGRLASSPES